MAAASYISFSETQQVPTESCTSGTYLPHECNCKLKSLYYECVNGQYVERECAAGKIFDDKSGRCVTQVYCPPTGYKLIPDEANCSLYYECMNGVKTEKTCENGLSFDTVKHMCSWPPSSECSLKQTNLDTPRLLDTLESSDDYECPATGNTRVPHECSCTKFYSCENGQKFLENCPDGMIYDYIRHECNYPYNAVCKHRKNDNYPTRGCVISNDCDGASNKRFPHKQCRLYYECQGRLKCVRSCLEGHVFNPIVESCDRWENNPDLCQDYEDFTTPKDQDCQSCTCDNCVPRYPDSTNCSRYIECENNKKVPKECPPNLAYNPNKQICDYPQNVNCSRPHCNEGEVTHHECQCGQYYQCKNGRLKVEHCRNGSYFDWEDKECRPPDVVRCYPRGCIGVCPSNGITTLPHDDCHKYCECTQGNAKVVSCDKKQIYDPKQRKCIPPENVKNQTCELFPCDPNSNSTSLIPHECLCDRYYKCNKGEKYREICESGTYFDYVQERCVESKDAHCYKSEPCSKDPDCGEVKCTADGSTSSHKDCTKYCICRNGYGVTENCPQGLYFDKVSGKCAWPENVDLEKNCQPFNCTDNVVPHECNCTLYYQCEKGEYYREECDGSYFDYVLGKCVNIAEDPHCYHESKTREVDGCVEHCPKQTSVRPIIRMRHRKCSQYCVCSLGAPYIVRCPDNQEYNERTKSCTSPETARCQPQPENENKPSFSNFPFVDYL